MAYSEPTEDLIGMVMEITGSTERDRPIITAALQQKGNDVEAVIAEFFDAGADKFRSRYGWDETPFLSNREGDEPSAAGGGNPSFVIHPPDDNQVLYGADPYPGAPSRPPSRTNNRSPMSTNMVDLSSVEYTGDTPISRQEEEAQLQRAINESLNASGVQSPQPPPGPPPLPPLLSQQESGITSAGLGHVHFGPANRPDYDPNEWAMIQLKNNEADPEPARRGRTSGVPAFLRCRSSEDWKQHRLGGLLTVLHSIPAARNVLLRTGPEPPYGYGQDPEWWKGNPILPPDMQRDREKSLYEGLDGYFLPPWCDEVHRLIAFLDSTERSYGTADILADCRHEQVNDSGDREWDFFLNFLWYQRDTDDRIPDTVLTSTYNSIQGSEQNLHQCNITDVNITGQDLPEAKSLYDILDRLYFADPDVDMEIARSTSITQAAKVTIFRFTNQDGFSGPIDIPETLYIDRYLASNREMIAQYELEKPTLRSAVKESHAREKHLTEGFDPKSQKSYDRRTIGKAAIQRCWEKIRQIKNQAFWKDHQEDRTKGEAGFYLPEHTGQPNLTSDEALVVAYYEAKIRTLETNLADIDSILNNIILPERAALEKLSEELLKGYREPSPKNGWNPTHRYTLRGVVSEVNKVFLRRREPVLMEMDDASAPVEQWLKIWVSPEDDNVVMSEPTTFDVVLSEGCGHNKCPVLIYATEKVMDENPDPLSSALRTFVKFDNRHFKQEQVQSELHGLPREKKRGSPGGAGSQPKRRNRSNSMDSMATNQASVGDLDDDMRDAPFENDDDLPVGVSDSIVMNMDHDDMLPQHHREHREALVDVSDSQQRYNAHSFQGDGSVDDPVDLLTPDPEAMDYTNTNGLSGISEFGSSPSTVGRTSRQLASVYIDSDQAKRDESSINGGDIPLSSGTTQNQQPEMKERATMPLLTRADTIKSLSGDRDDNELASGMDGPPVS
ncbi:hypothetical protein B0H66DRAFT_123462 [Apodospora peruviana]|uniref:Ubiquitin interaction domain-containing protein n=1 Tax=Apodospora peruviana TaxID=516989 RepID=A0AAE0II52_9PEZI|nr:hypothetical protein B0H66DRAFT_123462 [Apodospora peruviana]